MIGSISNELRNNHQKIALKSMETTHHKRSQNDQKSLISQDDTKMTAKTIPSEIHINKIETKIVNKDDIKAFSNNEQLLAFQANL